MRLSIFTLLIGFIFLFTASCRRANTQLSGFWAEVINQDTISRSWQPSTKLNSFKIRTDSGIFEHEYKNGTLLKPKRVYEIDAYKFRFVTDSLGVIEIYSYNLKNQGLSLSNNYRYVDSDSFQVISSTNQHIKLRWIPSHVLRPFEVNVTRTKDTLKFHPILRNAKAQDWSWRRIDEL